MAVQLGRSTSASVVLVHGGFLGPWSWSGVARTLEQHKIPAYVPDLPSMGDPGETPLGDFYADAAEVRRILDGLRFPCWCAGTPTAVRSSPKRLGARIQRWLTWCI